MARAKTYRTKLIVLKKTKLGEQDQILTCLAESGSQVRVVAKGARKPGSRLAARCELFCEVDALLACGKSLDVVAEAALIEPHKGIAGDFYKLSCAEAISEIAELSCFEDAQDGFLYPLLSRALRAVEQAQDQPHLDLVLAAYAFKVLAHGGWRPELEACISCGDPHPSRFSAASGGVLCESCAKDVAGAEVISTGELSWLVALIGRTFTELLEADIDVHTANFVVSLAHVWSATMLDARLRSFEFYLGV